jgi:hypothetical protein
MRPRTDDLTFVDDLLPAIFAINMHACATKDAFNRSIQEHGLDFQQLGLGHGLVRLQLRKVAARFAWGVGGGLLTHIRLGGNAQRLFGFYIDKCGSDLTVVFDPHRSMPDRTAGGNLDSIGEAAIRFKDDQQALVAARGTSSPSAEAPASPIRAPSTWRGQRWL